MISLDSQRSSHFSSTELPVREPSTFRTRRNVVCSLACLNFQCMHCWEPGSRSALRCKNGSYWNCQRTLYLSLTPSLSPAHGFTAAHLKDPSVALTCPPTLPRATAVVCSSHASNIWCARSGYRTMVLEACLFSSRNSWGLWSELKTDNCIMLDFLRYSLFVSFLYTRNAGFWKDRFAGKNAVYDERRQLLLFTYRPMTVLYVLPPLPRPLPPPPARLVNHALLLELNWIFRYCTAMLWV